MNICVGDRIEHNLSESGVCCSSSVTHVVFVCAATARGSGGWGVGVERSEGERDKEGEGRGGEVELAEPHIPPHPVSFAEISLRSRLGVVVVNKGIHYSV